jgi:hypothetical protein
MKTGLFCLFALLLLSSGARAQLTDPGDTSAFFRGTVPENPVVGEPYFLSVSSGQCETITIDANAANIVSSAPQALTVEVRTLFSSNCGATPGERIFLMPARQSAGPYSIQLIARDTGNLFGFIGTRTVTAVPAGTAGSAPRQIPSLGLIGALVAALGLLWTGMRRLD